MSILSFIISPDNFISWVLKDPSGDLINHGVAASLKEFLDIKAEHIEGLYLSPTSDQKRIASASRKNC